MSTLVATYQQVQSRIHRACEQTGRPRSEVKLLAVSKTKPATMVKEIYDQGQRSFGENYLQDALDKIEALTELTDIEWHFIGPIQSNKTRPIAEKFQWVETLEREKIAQRLNEQRPAELPALNVLIQVNISGEAQKSGLKSEEVADFADLIATLPNLTLRGLMCIPEATDDEQKLAQQFDNMHKLLQSLQNKHPQCDTLSMGMSADLELAVKHHTTQVRIGTDILAHALKETLMTKICFIGGGNMATSLIGGLIAQGQAADSICVSDPNQDQLDKLAKDFSVKTESDNIKAVADADLIMLAVKPQVMKQVIEPIADAIPQSALIVSIAAGINLYSFEKWLGKERAIVRCMPNTPALIQLGASGLYANGNTSDEQKKLAEEVLSAAGIVQWVEHEKDIDAVTAVSGSGPAYYFLLMEAMIDAGVELGLSRETATELTVQTAVGAAQMAKQSDVDAAELRRRVTSPGGTTEQAINTFEGAHLRDIVKAALKSANDRSGELAAMLGEK